MEELTMEKRQKDDLVFLVPEKRKYNSQFRSYYFLWFLISFGIAVSLLSFAGWYYAEIHFRCPGPIVKYIKIHTPVCSGISDLEKFDCHPDVDASAEDCLKRSCCYQAVSGDRNFIKTNVSDFPPLNVPYCYYPINYNGYTIVDVSQSPSQLKASLKRYTPSGFPKDIQNLQLVITFLDDCTLRLKITDSDAKRFEVPIPINDSLKPLKEPCYNVTLDPDSGQLIVKRKSTGTVIFRTDLKRLVYADQFLQLSSDLPSPYIYGIGEHYGSFLRNVNWSRITILNSDRAPVPDYPLYGAHPFYLSVEEDGKANGVFLLNSNAMDVILQPKPAITFRPIGGILDFFIMLGPTPANVVQQFTGIVGRTFMPPYWSLGFHLCRYGYNSLNKTRETMQRTIDAGIPLDVQWNDIDYMDGYKDFTYDEVNFAGLPEFVDELHTKGMHYVLMTDPGLSGSEKPGTYPPFDDGVMEDIFIKNPNGSIFRGKVWSDGDTVFPDFSHPKTEPYWIKLFSDFYAKIKYDGVWIDMNEPSNFYDGGKQGCEESTFEDPPYVPNGNLPLRHKTLCMTSKQYSSIHYNEHNLHAYREATATNKALRDVREKRPFIISRASFAGQGTQSGHWSGDISSSWEDMRYSIPSLLNFNLYGMSMIGSDICGFNYNTTAHLCARWQSLGAFYPFSRNHNERSTIEQDPVALGKVVVDATINSLTIRYQLLPYLYTLFYRSHIYGDTVIRPLFFEFPYDKNTYPIDEQFLWGPAIMISPALYPNVSSVTSYLPKGTWYNGRGLSIKSSGEKVTFPCSETDIVITVRGGFVIPVQTSQAKFTTTTASRKGPFLLAALLDEEKKANGELYWDDGDSLKTYEKGEYNLIHFTVNNNTLKSDIIKNGYTDVMALQAINVNGIDQKPTEILVNGIKCRWVKASSSKENVTSLFNFDESVTASDQANGKEVECLARATDFMFTVGLINVTLLSPLTVVWN